MMRRILQGPALLAAGLALLLVTSPISAYALWGYHDDMEYGYYDDGAYDDDWYYDYYDYGIGEEDWGEENRVGVTEGEEMFEEREYEEGSAYDDPGDQGLLDW